ncbi:MAG: DHA2 family efflux MFS transporter permease subunit [Alphaproteobacteria bacterium]|nr:DHA2 family efflux MFS transporter permease subunit [Alphaproteobacteria bacterium]
MSDHFIPVENRGLITIAVMLGTTMQVLDTTIANVALPSMMGDLGASPDTVTWVLTSYIVAAAIMTPVTGWLSDRLCRREFFLISIAGFTITSMMAGLSWNLGSIVMFRLIQGMFGAAIVPLSQTFMLEINPKEKHGPAMAIWGAGIMVGPIIGPTLGGWLTDVLNWRWVFFINLPIGILSFLGSAAYLPRAVKRLRGFDFFGFAMLSLGVGALQMLLDRGNVVDWFSSIETWIELGLSITGFWVFTVHLVTAKDTFIDAHIFRDRNLVTGLGFIFVVGIILLASLVLLPPMLEHIFHYSSTTTGFVMAPRGIGTMISMLIVGQLILIIDVRVLVMTGLALIAWSLHIMTQFTPQMDDSLVIISGVIQGLGLGLVFVPLSTITLATLDKKFRTDGASLFSLVRNIGSGIGISIVTVLMTRNTQVNHMELSEHITPYNPLLQQLSPAAAAGNPTALSVVDLLVQQQALLIAYIDDFRFMMLLTLSVIPLVLLLRVPKNKDP